MARSGAARRAAWSAVWLAAALAAPSCSAPPKGALMLAISTDMQAPKDVDVISVLVTTDGVPKFDYLGRVLPDGTVSLPSTLAIVQPDKPNAAVRVRVIAFQTQTDGSARARVMRDVLTTVPDQRTALLRIPLSFLDDGSATGTLPVTLVPSVARGVPEGLTTYDPATTSSSDPGFVKPACDFAGGLTSVAGACVPATASPSLLPDYTVASVYGPKGNPDRPDCFDVPTCFATSAPVTGVDMAACKYAIPAGEDGQDWNCALATTDGTGLCSGGVCLVPLENDPVLGFSIQKGVAIQMVPGVCKKLQEGASLVIDKTSCTTKVPSRPVCQPLGAGPDGGSPGDAGPAADATVGDGGGGPEGGGDGASADGPPAEGGPPDGGVCTGCSGACLLGRCVLTLATGGKGLGGVAVDTMNVYWTDTTAGSVLQAPQGGGATVTLASAQTTPFDILVHGSNVYWSDENSDVLTVPIGGGAVSTLLNDGAHVFGLAADARNLYYTDRVATTGGVFSCPFSVGVSSPLAAAGAPQFVAAAAGSIYWTDSGAVLGEPVSKPFSPTTLASGAPAAGASDVAVDATSVYWTASAGVFSVPLKGGKVTTLAKATPAGGLALGTANVYYTTASGIMTVPKAGGAPVTLARPSAPPIDVAVTSASVYWIDSAGGVLSASPNL